MFSHIGLSKCRSGHHSTRFRWLSVATVVATHVPGRQRRTHRGWRRFIDGIQASRRRFAKLTGSPSSAGNINASPPVIPIRNVRIEEIHKPVWQGHSPTSRTRFRRTSYRLTEFPARHLFDNSCLIPIESIATKRSLAHSPHRNLTPTRLENRYPNTQCTET